MAFATVTISPFHIPVSQYQIISKSMILTKIYWRVWMQYLLFQHQLLAEQNMAFPAINKYA